MGHSVSVRGGLPPLEGYGVPTAFGELCIGWEEAAAGVRVGQIFLPDAASPAVRMTSHTAPPVIVELGARLQAFLAGEAVTFDLALLALERCGDFQRRVLLAEAAILRGWVSTYGRMAAHLGTPGAGRAVGNALARNPFPLVIPCHRAVRSDGALGGYQGGVQMKRKLLALEGVAFRDALHVSLERVWYL
ncbi:MAG TPA: methylated-DNA--[protein]-cysteine S-methyltransferase [Anaerolineae bacterium]|nr:methylated-DNA--[protein]-cysteine S-methyltransferase [Anaerolineae bacterium]